MTSALPVSIEEEQEQAKLNAKASYMAQVVVRNVKMILTARNLSQTSLASALGIKRASMSKKLKGEIAWSLEDLVKAAMFLETTPQKLMDDSLMREMLFNGIQNEKAAAGNTRPRLFVESVPSVGLEPTLRRF